jgi:hypothetical protein
MEKEQQRLDIEAKNVHREHGKEREKRQVCNYYSRFSFDGIQFGYFYGFLSLSVVMFQKLCVCVPVFVVLTHMLVNIVFILF